MVVSQGFGAPSLAVLGPKGVVELVVAGPFRSQGFAGAGRPAGSVYILKDYRSQEHDTDAMVFTGYPSALPKALHSTVAGSE